MELVLKTTMLLTVVFADPEGDGSYNYLLNVPNTGTTRQYLIAHSYEKDMELKEGDQFYALVEAKCQDAWALDDIKALEGPFPWGVPRKTYICNADSITIGDKRFISLIRTNK